MFFPDGNEIDGVGIDEEHRCHWITFLNWWKLSIMGIKISRKCETGQFTSNDSLSTFIEHLVCSPNWFILYLQFVVVTIPITPTIKHRAYPESIQIRSPKIISKSQLKRMEWRVVTDFLSIGVGIVKRQQVRDVIDPPWSLLAPLQSPRAWNQTPRVDAGNHLRL